MVRDLNSIVDDYVGSNCSPTEQEREIVKNEYAKLRNMLPGESFQSGSYARFTAITPLNDLDVIWVVPKSTHEKLEENSLTLDSVFSDLVENLRREYRRAGRRVNITGQSHSIMIEFIDLDVDFSIDIVPAYELTEKNEFGNSLYRIPEIGVVSRQHRKELYDYQGLTSMVDWIKTDPQGYIEQARRSNELTRSFRRATKLLKKWKFAWKKKNNFKGTEFKLKSFHIEIAIQQLVSESPNLLSTLDYAEKFMENMDFYLKGPHFRDRAQTTGMPTRYIDQYMKDLDIDQKRMLRIAARSGLIITQKLRKSESEYEVKDWLNRLLSGEEFIEAYGHQVNSSTIRDKTFFAIDGYVRKKPGFTFGWLTKSQPLQKGLTRGINSRQIDFRITKNPEKNYVSYWKVRNTGVEAIENGALRGEISKHSTLSRTETTSYKGLHFVTCYLVDENKGNVVALDNVRVKII